MQSFLNQQKLGKKHKERKRSIASPHFGPCVTKIRNPRWSRRRLPLPSNCIAKVPNEMPVQRRDWIAGQTVQMSRVLRLQMFNSCLAHLSANAKKVKNTSVKKIVTFFNKKMTDSLSSQKIRRHMSISFEYHPGQGSPSARVAPSCFSVAR